MSPNILITGATGYIGGTILHHLLKATLSSKIFAIVRTDEQEQLLSNLNVTVLRTDLKDEEAISLDVLENDVGIVINTTSALDPSLGLPLISALGERKRKTGRDSFYIHTSGATAFANKVGFERASIKDTEDVFSAIKETEKKTSYPVRATDIAVTEHALEQDVISYIIVPPLVYGRGSGKGNKISVGVPTIVRSIILAKRGLKSPSPHIWQGTHVNDLAQLYLSLIHLLASNNPPHSGKEGFIFASAHEVPFWEVTERLSELAFQRGLSDTKQVGVWKSEEQAAEVLDVPVFIVSVVMNSSTNPIFDKGDQVEWKPEWTKEHFIESLDDEIQAVLDAGENGQTLADMVKKSKGPLSEK